MVHRIALADNSRSETKPHTVHEPFVQDTARVKTTGSGSHHTRNRSDRIVAVHPSQFCEVVSRTDRDDAERGITVALEQAVGDFMHGAITANRIEMARTLAYRLGGKLLAVPRSFSAEHIHRPPLSLECPVHGGLGASG